MVRTAAELERHRPAWERLVDLALEPNAFHEPFFLLPALEAFAAQAPEVALVFAEAQHGREGTPVLCGLFPLRPLAGGLAGGTWAHSYCFLGTPLVRRDFAAETLAAFFGWLRAERRWRVFRFAKVPGDGPFHRALWDAVRAARRPSWIQDRHQRALFRPDESPQAFRKRAISYSTRKELRRLRRRLADQGELRLTSVDASGQDGEVAEWVERFVALEAAGWKGRAGTAFRSSPADERFLHAVVAGAHQNRRLAMLCLELDGRPLAMNCAFTTADGGFYFKIAHDEEFARFSPGMLLEHDFVDWLHGRDGLAWMDSCADPGHPMIERLWDGRRAIETVWVGTGRIGQSATLALFPLARGLKRAVKPGKEPR